MQSLLATKKLKPISRSKANDEIKALLDRVADIAVSSCPVEVDEIAVYGSFLDSSRSTINDIDLAFSTRRKSWAQDNFQKAGEPFMKEHPPVGWSLVPFASWPYRWIERQLKARRPALAISDMDNLKKLGCRNRIIYPVVRNVPASPNWVMPSREVVIAPH